MKRFFLFALGLSTIFYSCSDDDSSTSNTSSQIEVPATYTFEREGESTVSYSGQTARISMANEITSAMNDENQTETALLNMFSNENNPFTKESLNTSGKSIKSKTAASNLYFSGNSVESNAIKADFESFLIDQANEVFPNWNTLAEEGQAGQIVDGSKTRYVNSQGLELNQAFAKGLMGALQADQMLNNYLATSVLDEGDNRLNNETGVTEEGKLYTTMEHKWDEAYGYLYGDTSVSTENPMSVIDDNEDQLLFKYMKRVDADDDFSGIAQETFNAFKTGRAAIVDANYEVRDEQVATIRENISLIFAVRAIHYLQAGKSSIENGNREGSFHALSEAYGFLYSIRFSNNPQTNQPYLSKEELDSYLEMFTTGSGLWTITAENLETISVNVATAFGLTIDQID